MTPTWPASSYDRHGLPVRVLQFGTGMLLRALPAAMIDDANRAGTFGGRIAVVQSTASGVAASINAQDGLFTLMEQGIVRGEPVRRSRVVGSIARALVADSDWRAVRDAAAQPELRVIISNVTEAGFRLDDHEPPFDAGRPSAPHSYPAKLVDLLFARCARLGDGPGLFVIPTELIADNGPQLAAMVDRLAGGVPDADRFRAWLRRNVRFCSSLVDRITTGAPAPEHRAALESRLGYHDALLTLTEPHALWAIEADPGTLREAFPVDEASGGALVFAPDISSYRERKLRMLNGTHTVVAPMALLAGVRTVREAVEHPHLGQVVREVLFDEIFPAMPGPATDAAAYAGSVLDRFRNPWLDHEWRVIATNQTAKLRLRVLPSIIDFQHRRGAIPQRLAQGLAASFWLARAAARNAGEGWWSGHASPIVDLDRHLIDRHWRQAESGDGTGRIPAALLAGVAAGILGDESIWGRDLREIPGLTDMVSLSLDTFQP